MRFRILLILLLITGSHLYFAQEHEHDHEPGRVVVPKVSPALKFTENLGQWEDKILFRATMYGGAMWIERDALTFSFFDQKKFAAIHHGGLTRGLYKDASIQCHAYRVHFENCNPVQKVEKSQPREDYENFFIGKDQKKWKSFVKSYHQVWLRELYNSIDYEIITAVNGMKYNFHVKPGGNVNEIKMRYEGVDKLRIKDGALHVGLSVNSLVEQKPYAYQLINGKVKVVKCNYVLKDNVISFAFPDGYDRKYTLVIDPILVFSASSGSSANNFGMTATFDMQGHLYAGGTVYDNGYPTTLGAFNVFFTGTVANGITDIGITKYSPNGTSLIYSTYVGGSQSDVISSMIVDHSGNLCFYGATGSIDFPVQSGAYDQIFNGGAFISWISNGTTFNFGTDIYVAKLNATGSSMLGCTYLGGSANDGINYVNYMTPGPFGSEHPLDSLMYNYGDQYRGEIQVDVVNNIYIASSTRSGNFPTVNAFDNTLGGKQDAVVCKFNSALTQLLYSTYLGGSLNDCGNGLIVNDQLEVFVTGGTCSSDFPTTPGAFSTTYNGGKTDGFLTRFNATGNSLLQSTFIGTSSYDQSYFVQSDKYNHIYVYGQSLGNIAVVTASNQTSIYSNPGRHQFIRRFNPTLSNVSMSTVFGNYTNTVDISPCAFAVDKCLNIYISGWGGTLTSTLFPLGSMPMFQPTQSVTTGFDFYFMGLDSNANAIKYGSYFGGAISQEHVDGGTSRFDPGGRIYQSACAGCQNTDDWPVSPGAWPNTPGNPNHSFGCNNGVVKLDFQLQTAIATIQTATMAGCTPMTITFTNGSMPTNPGATFKWYLSPGVTNTSNLNPTITYNTPGTYTVSLVIRDNLTCNKVDSAITYITVYNKPVANINIGPTGCSNTIQVSNSSTGNLGPNAHFWNFGNNSTSTLGSLTYTYPANGNYNLSYTVTDVNGCKDVQTSTVNIFNFSPGAVSQASMCAGQGATLNATGGTSYSWSPSSGLNNATSASPVANPPSTTVYSVTVTNNSMGYPCVATLSTQVVVHPNPVANYSLDTSPCTNTVATLNFSSGNLGPNPFEWTFGDGSPALTTPSPMYSYSATGTYSVVLTVTDILGCRGQRTETVSVFNFTPGVVTSGSLCYGAARTLTAAGGTSYTWTPGAGLSNSVISNPSASPTISTIYTVQVDNNTPGYTCSRSLTTEIIVRPTPTTNFNFSLNPCGGGVHFLDQSAADISTWQWTLSPTRTSTVQSPYNFYDEGGNFTVTLITTNIFGCQHQLEKPLIVKMPPPLEAGGDTAICRGSSYQLWALGGNSYQWSPSSSLDNPNISNPVATPSISTEYSVNISTDLVVGGQPCVFMLTTAIRVDVLSATPVSAVAQPTLVTTGDPTQLTYFGEPGALVSWLPSGATTPVTGYTVVAFPQQPTTYTAVASRGTCREDVTVKVDAFTAGCEIGDFFVPNTFTPNGDGNNDVLFVRGLKIDEVYFTIYNRWGEMVFETSDKNKGWDGKYQGKEADVGVFGWYLRAKCVNGLEAFHKGNVTLIR